MLHMNKPNLLSFITILVAFLLTPAKAEDANIYALQFRDGHTTGSWILAMDGGVTYEIDDFTKDSNAKAIEDLGALHPEIVRLNTAPEHNIYLVGHLQPLESHPPKAKMRLDGWFIKAPFYLPPVGDPDGLLNVSHELKVSHFLPAGERDDSEATLKLRASLQIHHDKRLNLFWIGVPSPVYKFLAKPE
jgi:hypothetical protein